MRLRKVFLYSLVIQVALSQLLLAIFVHKADLDTCIKAILSTCALWAIGLIIGVILCTIVKRPGIEPWLYICGQIVIYAVLSVFVSINRYKFRKQEGNAKTEEVYLKPDSRQEREKEIDSFLNSISELPDSLKQQLKDSLFRD